MSTNPIISSASSLQERLALNRMIQNGVNTDAALQRVIENGSAVFTDHTRHFQEQLHAQQEAAFPALRTQLTRINETNYQDVAELKQELNRVKTKVTEAEKRHEILSTALEEAQTELKQREEHRDYLLNILEDKAFKKAIIQSGQGNIETLNQIGEAATHYVGGVPNIKREIPSGPPPIKRGGHNNV